MTSSLNLPISTPVVTAGQRLPRLVLFADCTTCGRVSDEANDFSIPQQALAHTALTGHVVVLNGTADLPEDEDYEGDHAQLVSTARSAESGKNFYVDLPTEDCIGNEEGAWKNVAVCSTRHEAIAFAQEHFGADAEGRVSLVTG